MDWGRLGGFSSGEEDETQKKIINQGTNRVQTKEPISSISGPRNEFPVMSPVLYGVRVTCHCQHKRPVQHLPSVNLIDFHRRRFIKWLSIVPCRTSCQE